MKTNQTNSKAGEWVTRGTASRVAVAGNYAYLAEGSRREGTNSVGGGLVILDVSDPMAPSNIGVYGEGGFFRTVAVSGNFDSRRRTRRSFRP